MEHLSPNPETDPKELLLELAAEFGFVEGEELKALRDLAATDPTVETRGKLMAYRIAAEESIKDKEGVEYGRAQLGLLLSVASLKYQMEMHESFRQDLEDISTYALHTDEIILGDIIEHLFMEIEDRKH